MTEERGTEQSGGENQAGPASPAHYSKSERAEKPARPEAASHVRDKRHTAEPDLQTQLERAKKEAAEHLDDLKRLQAEFENYRKRVLREQTSLVGRASEQLVERLLPILDNFELALIAADRTKDYEALVRGVEIVFGELMDLLHKEGLKKIDAVGKPFDPTHHEAVLEVGDGPPDGEPVVAEVVRNGYTLKGKVVRPAMVKVVRR